LDLREDLVAAGQETVELAGHGLHGLDCTRHEGSLHLGDCIVDAVTGAFVQDLDAEQLRS
jgi:hypothetical protein